ncbi:MAG: SIMPL domain-containing protein [Eubacteriales bacterium]|nr:SIMPL domain-containing protein [Eubacteriales bacterium]
MTKKLFASLLSLALVLALAVPGLAQNASPRLTVTGQATVSIDADYATIEIGAMTRGNTAGEAQGENDRIMQGVIEALKELGVKEEDIRTSMFSVYTDQAVEYGLASGAPVMPPYVVTNMIYVIIRDISLVSEVIDAAANKGANNVYSLIFQASENAEATQQAINLAVKNAQDRADMLALAAGKALGELVEIQSPVTYADLYMARESYAMPSDAGAPIISGKVAVSAEVTLVFELK